MKKNNRLLLLVKNLITLSFWGLSIACVEARDSPDTYWTKEKLAEVNAQIAQSVRDLSPAKDFEENKANNNICFYSFGNFMSGLKIPGITEDDKKFFIEGKSIPVVNKFSDESLSPFESDAYWDAVVAYLKEYNSLVLKYLKETSEKSVEKGDVNAATSGSGTTRTKSITAHTADGTAKADHCPLQSDKPIEPVPTSSSTAAPLSGATNVNISLSFDQQPLYLEATKAMSAQDYMKARDLILELGKFDLYKARSIRELGILETNLDMNQAVGLFKKAFNLGDKESFALYLDALAQAGRFDELKPYQNEIFWGALNNRYLLRTFCLAAEYRNREDVIRPFLLIARRAPVEIVTDNLSLIRLLIKYGEPQDKLLVDFLKSEFNKRVKSRLMKDFFPVKEFQFPDDSVVSNYRKTDEYKFYAKYCFAHYVDDQKAAADSQEAIVKLSSLAENPQYRTLINSSLVAIALKVCDYLRVEQLCEVSLKIEDKRNEGYCLYSLFMSLIMQGKLDEAKKHESVFFDYTFSNPTDIQPSIFVKYCLLTNNNEMFLKWIRANNLELALLDLETKNLVLEALKKWGEQIDEPLINYIKLKQPKSNKEFDWSLFWGIPDGNGGASPIPKWQPPASLP